MLVEPNKAKTCRLDGKLHFEFHGERHRMFCQPHLRRGSLSKLANEYLHSETHLRFSVVLFFAKFTYLTMLTGILLYTLGNP